MLKLAYHSRETVSGKAALDLRGRRNGERFGARILHGIVRQQRGHGVRVGADFLDRRGEPFVDRAIHQSIGEPVHDHHWQGREQKRTRDHSGSKF